MFWWWMGGVALRMVLVVVLDGCCVGDVLVMWHGGDGVMLWRWCEGSMYDVHL